MRFWQLAFNVVSFLIAGFLVISALGILFIVLPQTLPEDRGMWHFTMSMELIVILSLVGGGMMNFARGELSTWPTAFMIAGYCMSLWLSPLAVWGIVLLRSKSKEPIERLDANADG